MYYKGLSLICAIYYSILINSESAKAQQLLIYQKFPFQQVMLDNVTSTSVLSLSQCALFCTENAYCHAFIVDSNSNPKSCQFCNALQTTTVKSSGISCVDSEIKSLMTYFEIVSTEFVEIKIFQLLSETFFT